MKVFKVLFYRSAFSHIMPYRPSTVTRDPEATRARAIEETSPSWYNLEVLSSDRPRATSSRLRTSWLKLASGSRDGHRRHAGLNGEGRTRAPSLCGIVVSYRRLGPELWLARSSLYVSSASLQPTKVACSPRRHQSWGLARKKTPHKS